MRGGWVASPWYFLSLGFLAGVVGFRMGFRTGNRVALPVLQGVLGWGVFVMAWSFLSPGWAAATVGAWAFGTMLISVYVFHGRPEETDARVVRAREYRASMLGVEARRRRDEHRVDRGIGERLRGIARRHGLAGDFHPFGRLELRRFAHGLGSIAWHSNSR